jgi:hypothetical protein
MPVIQPITSASSSSAYVPTSRVLTINGVAFDLTADRSWTVEVLDDLIATAPLSYVSGTNTISIPAATSSVNGYLTSADWLTFSSKQPAITLTVTGNSGASSLIGATLNVPTYTLAGLGGLSNPFSAAIGQIIYSNSAGAALSLLGNTTTTKKFLSQTGDGTNSDAPSWSTIAIGDVSGAISLTALSATSPLLYNNSTGVFSIQQASNLQSGFLSDADWTTFNGKQTQVALTTTGDSGASTFNFSTGALNIPEYTLAGLGGLDNPMTSLGDMIYSNSAGAPQRLAPNTTTTRKYLSMLGDGTFGAIPTWETITGITGSGTTNYIAKFTSSTAVGNSLIFDNGTNVGIGTPTPQAKLDVQGIILGGSNTSTEGTIILQDQYSSGHLVNLGSNRSSGGVVLGYGVYPSGVSTNAFISSTSIALERGALSFDGSFRWYTGSSQTVSIGTAATLTEKMILDNSGNLGIGMSTASYKLDVTGEARISSAIAIGTTPDTNNPFKILKNLNTTVGIKFENTNTSSLAFSAVQLGTDISGGTAFTNLVYGSSGTSEAGVFKPNGTALINTGSGGLNFLAVSQPIRFFTSTGNGTLRASITNDGDFTQFNGTNPSASTTDAFRMYSADVVAGNAAPHFRTENGAVIKLYQETTSVGNSTISVGGGSAVLDDTEFGGYTLRQVVKALQNQGILA